MILDGYAFISDNQKEKIPCHFENNILTLYFENPNMTVATTSEEKEHVVAIRKRGQLSGNYYLMHIPYPLSVFDKWPIPHSSNYEVDWYISNYNSDIKYNHIHFNFDELNYFIPPMSEIVDQENGYIFPKRERNIYEFSFLLDGRKINVKLYILSKKTNVVCPEIKCVSELSMSFLKTKDFHFIEKLYRIIADTFSFLCNRKNITLESAIIEGMNKKGNKSTSFLTIVEKYKDPIEKEEIISKTIKYPYVKGHFDQLIRLIASNYDKNKKGKVSVHGIHPSVFRRNLIDLRQSMNIMSAFEFHVRELLPDISSDETIEVYTDIKKLIEEKYVSIVTGKKKRTAKEIIKHLSPAISLETKIKKTITGYKEWKSLEVVIKQFFPDWNELATVANEWRNEIAHEKRIAIPSEETIKAIRLVELLNYCIILRSAKFSNRSITQIVDVILDIKKQEKKYKQQK